MAIREVSSSERTTYPYSAVGVIFVTFPNGQAAQGTVAVVGRNDILTATHVLYSPERGGWATRFSLYFGADYNNVTDRFDSTTYSYSLAAGSFTWDARAWPANVFADASPLLTYAESQYDVAIIGLSVAVGDSTGWFGMDPGRDFAQTVTEIGYPSDGTGMMVSSVSVSHNTGYQVYTATTNTMGPGSSGGPLFSSDWYVLGVKSAGLATTSTWADVGFLSDAIVSFMESNNAMITGGRAIDTSTTTRPVASQVDVIAGLSVYRALFGISAGSSSYSSMVSSLATSSATAYAIDQGNQFNAYTPSQLSTLVLGDMSITASTLGGGSPGASYAALQGAFAQYLAVYWGAKGQVVMQLASILGNLENDAVFGLAARTFNTNVRNDYVRLAGTLAAPGEADNVAMVGIAPGADLYTT